MRQLINIVVILFIAAKSYALPAFPGAEGFGSDTAGGRGGTVYIVDTLSDDPAAGVTLREACEASGPRYVVFAVSGHIYLTSQLLITNSNLTIAGQTSPGGICITGYWVKIEASDIIITHMRFRPDARGIVDYDTDGSDNIRYYDQTNYLVTSCTGSYSITPPTEAKYTNNTYYAPCTYSTSQDPEDIHALIINGAYWSGNPTNNIVIDHCSFAYGVDETVAITGGTTGITFSHNIVAAGISYAGHSSVPEHSKGLLIATYGSSAGTGNVINASVHHNYITQNYDRNPVISGAQNSYDVDVTADVVNNVISGWYGRSVGMSWEDVNINWVYNYMDPGPWTTVSSAYEIIYNYQLDSAVPILYVLGNLGVTRLSQEDADWNVGDALTAYALSNTWQQTTRFSAPAISDEAEMSYALAESILADVGATKPSLDSIDQAWLNYFNSGTSIIPLAVGELSYPTIGYATYSTPTSPVDSDSDGMADDWEISTFGDLTQTATGDYNSDGYDNIENYFQYLTTDEDTTGSVTVLRGISSSSKGISIR